MKYINFYKISLLVLFISISSCSDDILDRFPEDAASDANFFTKSTDFQNYANGLYDVVIGNYSTGEVNTDNILTQSPYGGLQQRNNSSIANQTNNVWNNNYSHIRSVNYMLNNVDKLVERDAIGDHYIGEGYFMRAWFYYELLKTFGGVPYIDQVLSTDSEALYKPRETRDFIATKIIEDLDNAIDMLQWSGSGAAVTGRINKEAALHLKTRVGLYEGSWEHYHGVKRSPYAVSGSDGSIFLNAAVDAGNVLIAHQGNNVFKGPAGDEYSRLFNNENVSGLPGVFLFRAYEPDLGLGSDQRSLSDVGISLTKAAIDNYLMADGLPEEISITTSGVDIADQNSVINSRDPRLRQTLYAPDRGPREEVLVHLKYQEGVKGIYKPAAHQNQISTGYFVWKGEPLTYAGRALTAVDDVIFRYGESLLNYAEAKAILGNITQTDINNTVNVLRDRVGAVNMNLSTVNGWNVTYSEKDGYDPSAPNIVNEIRRERRVELMLEGYRNDDLKRWAIYENVINGYIPVSAYYQELVDYFEIDQNLINAGYPVELWEQARYSEGVNSGQINGYLTPFFENPDFNSSSSDGYYIEPGRDYLNSIPQVEIDLYKQKADVILTQNPGWI